MANATLVSPNLQGWLALGERGVSSESMVRYLVYGQRTNGFNDPADPSDFRRCELLLRWVPELREEFPRMAEVSRRWASLVAHWDEIRALLEEEIPDVWTTYRGGAKRTYALMQNLDKKDN